MLKKRQRKQYPPGTFIPTPARVCAIIQLCLAFTIILWYASQPFVGEIFTLKSRLLFYHDLMGIPSRDDLPQERLERLQRNTERFQKLPVSKQLQLKNEASKIQQQFGRSFFSKLGDVAKIFAFEFSPFELLWLILSIVIPIMLLKRVEGATQVVWLLPLLVACYALENRMVGIPAPPLADSLLFPSEQELISGYVERDLSPNVLEQQDQLIRGWHKYLVIHWGKDGEKSLASDSKTMSQRVEDAEFNFTLARLESRSQQAVSPSKREIQQPTPLLAVYFFWNFFFAFTAARRASTSPCKF